jgi:hypothetical protein
MVNYPIKQDMEIISLFILISLFFIGICQYEKNSIFDFTVNRTDFLAE